MVESKLKRLAARNLVGALIAARNIPDIPWKFRYAIKRNLDSLQSDYEGTNESFPEPKKEETELHAKWEAEWKAHMQEEITVNLYMTQLPDGVNATSVPKEHQALHNQTIVEFLFPIIKE